VLGYKKYCNYCIHRKCLKNCKEYWIDKGYTGEEIENKRSQFLAEAGSKIRKWYTNNKKKYRTGSCRCPEYWIKRGHTSDEAQKILSDNSRNAGLKFGIYKKMYPDKYVSCFLPEYWIKKGLSIEEANIKVKEYKNRLKNKHTIEKYIEKYGIHKGTEIYNQYKKSKAQTLEKFIRIYGKINGTKRWKDYRYKNKQILKKLKTHGWSNISQEIFWEIYKNISHKYKNIYFATNDNGIRNDHINNEFLVELKNGKYYRLDFYIKDLNKWVEYDDPKWHDVQKDKIRETNIKKELPGAKCLRILSLDYKKNKDIIIKKCIDFLEAK